jgi:hypothetical protein
MDERSAMQARVDRLVRRGWRSPNVRELAASVWDRVAGTEEKRRVLRRWTVVFGPLALVAVGVGAWLVLRPVPVPDYRRDNLRKVFNFTLLTDQFNRLPVQERLELIGTLVERLKSMDSGDSALMAAFAAGIAGAAREQLEKNASKLAIDVWDMYAKDYASVPAADRDGYLDKTFIEFTKMMETVAGEPREISDAERLAEGRRQAKRDQEQMAKGNGPPPRAMGRMFALMNDNIGGHASPAQRTRGQLLMRDMVRRLRGPG